MNKGLVAGAVAGITVAIAFGSIFYAKTLVNDAKQKSLELIRQYNLSVKEQHKFHDEYERQLAEAKATIHEQEITITICEEMINKLNLKIRELDGDTKHQM